MTNQFEASVPLNLYPIRAGRIVQVRVRGKLHYYEVNRLTLEERADQGEPTGPQPGSVQPARVSIQLWRCKWLDPLTRASTAPRPQDLPYNPILIDLDRVARLQPIAIDGQTYLLHTLDVNDLHTLTVRYEEPLPAPRSFGESDVIDIVIDRAWWRDNGAPPFGDGTAPDPSWYPGP